MYPKSVQDPDWNDRVQTGGLPSSRIEGKLWHIMG